MSNPLPTQTPNVIIHDPKRRQVIYDIFGIAGLFLFAAIAADAVSPLFDIKQYTDIAVAVYTVLGGGVGYLSRQNTP